MMVRYLLRCVFILSLLIGFQCCNATDLPARTEKEAAAIAEAAFLEHTKHTITDYSIHPGPHAPKVWNFVFMGEKSFLAPGNNWGVVVDRKTGATEVTDGM
jgi:hypothetical protein